MTTAAVIVAAGRGARAGGPTPKQWRMIAGKRVIDWTLATFLNHPKIDQVVVVLHPDDIPLFEISESYSNLKIASGGNDRAASVRNGLKAFLANTPDNVLIHDVARPCITADLISNVVDALNDNVGAAPALAVSDALWKGDHGAVTGTADRSGLYRAQTPQGFGFEAILSAHLNHTGETADDVAVARNAGLKVAIIPGDENNLKITTPEDFKRAENILRGPMDIRTGNGFDVHAFTKGDHVILCGEEIPHVATLLGHSDADVAMHAVTDALYGALAKGDIGKWFSPSDPQWKGTASHVFLEHAANMARDDGFTISNVDCTIICESPKIGPHAEKMKTTLARLLQISPDRVSVKATTSENLGFTGRKEGIAAQATVTLVKS